MLLDSTHKRWFLVTLTLGVVAVAIYLGFRRSAPGELTGGSLVGLWYGVLGSGLMVYAGLLSALRKVPSWWWLGQRRTWLRGHVWLGLLSGVFILCHSGFRWGGPLEQALWGVLILIFASGIVGLVLQQVLPRLLTARVPREAPYEQIPHICEVMRDEADALIGAAMAEPAVKEELEKFYDAEVRPFLAAGYRRDLAAADPLRREVVFARVRALPGFEPLAGLLKRLHDFCEERRQLGEQERLHRWLHGWLLVHVPLALALLVLGVAHVVMALYY